MLVLFSVYSGCVDMYGSAFTVNTYTKGVRKGEGPARCRNKGKWERSLARASHVPIQVRTIVLAYSYSVLVLVIL